VSRNAFRRSTEVPRNGPYRPQSSARITSISDTVSTRSAAATAYFLTISSTARVYIRHRNFFSFEPFATAFSPPPHMDFPTRFQHFPSLFYRAQPFFAVPTGIYHLPRRPRNQLSTFKPYPCGPQTLEIGPPCLIRLFLRCRDRPNNLLRSFCTDFRRFSHFSYYHSTLIVFIISGFLQFFDDRR